MNKNFDNNLRICDFSRGGNKQYIYFNSLTENILSNLEMYVKKKGGGSLTEKVLAIRTSKYICFF